MKKGLILINKIDFAAKNLTSNAGLFLLLENAKNNGIFELIDNDLVFDNESTNKIKMNHIKTMLCGHFIGIQSERIALGNIVYLSGILSAWTTIPLNSILAPKKAFARNVGKNALSGISILQTTTYYLMSSLVAATANKNVVIMYILQKKNPPVLYPLTV